MIKENKMKKLTYLLSLLMLSTFVLSCETDTESVTNPGEFLTPTQFSLNFTDDNSNSSTFEGGTVTFSVGSATPLLADVTLSINVTSSDGTAEVTYPQTITLNKGESAVYFDVMPTDDGVAESGGEVYTVSITDITADYGGEHYVMSLDANRTINVSDPPTIVTTPGDVNITLTWTDGNIDIDLYCVTGVQDLNGTVVDSSAGITTTEMVTMPGSSADGNYSIYMEQWAFLGTPPDVNEMITVTFDFPDGGQLVYTDTFINTGWEFTLTKLTLGSTVGYLVNQL